MQKEIQKLINEVPIKKETAIIVGNTSKFHIGSYINCKNLAQLIAKKYNLIGFEGGKEFKFYSYKDFERKIKRSRLLKKIKKSDVIFCQGEGFIEPNSPYGKALFYLAKFIKSKYKDKKVFLINFSCYDPFYGDWQLFDKVIPRDYGSHIALKNAVKKIKLGFDCSIIEEIPRKYFNSIIKSAPKRKLVLVFRGRKQITKKQFAVLKLYFRDSNIIPVSSFWKFYKIPSKSISSRDQLFKLLSKAYLVVSSSFHGIIFSVLFSVPFIFLPTFPIPKNESLATDVLGKYFKKRSLEEWIVFFRREKNYMMIKKHLQNKLLSLKKRTLNYIK